MNRFLLVFLIFTTLIVSCKHEEIIRIGPIALTFDDGPDSIYTPRILDILKEKHIKATFFLIGKKIKQYPKIVERIAREGHSVGNHTYTHLYLPHFEFNQIETQITDTQNLIDSICGKSIKLFRPPWGAINKELTRKINNMGYKVVLWDIDPRDYDTIKSDAHSIVRTILARRNRNRIILMHSASYSNNESRKNTINALPEIIDDLTIQGFYFETIPELLNLVP
jgi:peptidoglycan/xylan/chitin deacetylase (PgdA/CDA1 family)